MPKAEPKSLIELHFIFILSFFFFSITVDCECMNLYIIVVLLYYLCKFEFSKSLKKQTNKEGRIQRGAG